MKKLNKKDYIYIFFICLILLLFAISLFMGISGWYYSIPLSKQFSISAEKPKDILLQETGVEFASFLIDGSLVSGQKLKQKINLKNNGSKSLFLRAKTCGYLEHEIVDFNFSLLNNWVVASDGYIYYQEKLLPNASIGLCEFVSIPNNIQFDSSQKYIFNIIIETIDDSNNIDNIWGLGKITI